MLHLYRLKREIRRRRGPADTQAMNTAALCSVSLPTDGLWLLLMQNMSDECKSFWFKDRSSCLEMKIKTDHIVVSESVKWLTLPEKAFTAYTEKAALCWTQTGAWRAAVKVSVLSSAVRRRKAASELHSEPRRDRVPAPRLRVKHTWFRSCRTKRGQTRVKWDTVPRVRAG